MLRRSLRRMLRYPSMTILLVGMPVVLLLLFVFVFGQTLGAGCDQEAEQFQPSFLGERTEGGDGAFLIHRYFP